MSITEIKVEYISLDELEQWPRNPKQHNLSGIEKSLKRFGFNSPLVIDERTGRLVAGHGRLKTLR